MEKQKLKALVFLLLVVSLVIVGCSGETSTDTEAENEMAGEITIWSWDVAAKSLEFSATEFKKEYPDVDIIIEDLGDDQVYDKLTTSLASGAGLPEIVSIEGERIASFGSKFPGKFETFNDVDKNLFLPAKISEATVNGEILAFPWDGSPAGIFYRKDLFDLAGIDAKNIKTWDDFIVAGEKMNEIGVKMIPVAVSRNDTLFRFLLSQQGGFYFDSEGNITINNEKSKKAMRILKEMHDADIIYDNVNWDGLVTSSKEGEVATVANAVWWAGTLQSECKETFGDWRVMPLPLVDENSLNTSVNGGSALMVPKESENSEIAKKFVEFAMTNEKSIINGFENYGLYPSYIPSYSNDVFNAEVEYFGDQKVWNIFAELGKNTPELNYTQYFGEANDLVVDAQSSILLEDGSIDMILSELEKSLKNKFE